MPIPVSVRPLGARTGVAAAVVLAAGLALADAPAAFAAPGDSGDLTILPSGEVRGTQRDGAVCKFKLVADNFETLPAIAWTITVRPPTVPPGDTLTGNLPLSQGRARSNEYRLADGTYQLQWTVPSGVTKQKTFVVHCDEGKNSGEGRDSGEGKDSGRSYHKPSGPVPAGGGGVPTVESAASPAQFGTAAALVAGAAGIAGLALVRKAARRRSRGEA
ncbi:hypothetical protein [Streptomyces sp. NPDC014894]|uniref:hypothetical protein n=1 Tax=unclassified Streptomyces TaxID=2593676 RepID=UPI0036FB14C1